MSRWAAEQRMGGAMLPDGTTIPTAIMGAAARAALNTLDLIDGRADRQLSSIVDEVGWAIEEELVKQAIAVSKNAAAGVKREFTRKSDRKEDSADEDKVDEGGMGKGDTDDGEARLAKKQRKK